MAKVIVHSIQHNPFRGELPSEIERDSVGLYLLDVMTFIATDLEENMSDKVVDLYRAGQGEGL